MAHNSKRNKRHKPNQDADDYAYPTKKDRGSKTRARNHDKNVIRNGLLAHENPDSFDNEEEDLIADQIIMDDYNEMITEFNAVDDPYDDDWYDDTPMSTPEDDYDDSGFEYDRDFY